MIDNANIFAVHISISYCSFSSLTFLSIVMMTFYIHFTRFCLKRKRLSDVRVISLTKKGYGFTVFFW